MIVPNNKKFLVYIKTAKTGSSSFVKILEKISSNSKVNYYEYKDLVSKNENLNIGDIIMIVNDQINFFIKEYPNIYKYSYFVLISRNPLNRFISGWKYHNLSKRKSIDSVINNPIYPPKKPYEIRWKNEFPKKYWDFFSLYNHVYCGQTETLVINGKFIIDYIIKFEDYNNEMLKFFRHLKLNESDIEKLAIPHEKKNNLNYLNIKSKISKELKIKIFEMFENDYKLLNYNIA
jgi:hypothetical protein